MSTDMTMAGFYFGSNDCVAIANGRGTGAITFMSGYKPGGTTDSIPGTHMAGHPAAAVFQSSLESEPKLYLAYQDAGGSQYCYYVVFDGNSWSEPAPISNVRLNASPSLAVYQGKLYMAHQGADSTGTAHTVWYATSSDGTTWSQDVNIPGVLINDSPALAAYQDKLYLVHQGSDTTRTAHTLWYTTYDGTTWTDDVNVPIPSAPMTGSPAVAVFNDKLYVAYSNNAQVNDSSNISCITFDGTAWSDPFLVGPAETGYEAYSIPAGASPTLWVSSADTPAPLVGYMLGYDEEQDMFIEGVYLAQPMP